MKKFLFGIREFAWMVADEIANWLYPYHNQLTPEQRFEVRVKDPLTGEMWMVEELIEQMNQKVDKMQDDMIWIKDKILEHEQKLSFKVKKRSQSPSVSGKIQT
tara:strand:- start:2025 stop:2333 length:309 start_codon:yes stop_codon:yes gene_type:complete